MRSYNTVYKILTMDYVELIVTPLYLKKIGGIDKVRAIEAKAYTDDQYNKLIEDEVNQGLYEKFNNYYRLGGQRII